MMFLGPLLFCLYVNDLQLIRLTEVARVVADWASRKSLTLNTKKTRAIAFSSSHTVGQFDSLDYPGINIAKGEKFEFVTKIKSVGVILDSTLSWKPQIIQVAKRANCALFGLRFIISFIPK